jgi:hypothetical protein
MYNITEQCLCIKFYVKLKKVATQTYKVLKPASGEETFSYTKHFSSMHNLKRGKIMGVTNNALQPSLVQRRTQLSLYKTLG